MLNDFCSLAPPPTVVGRNTTAKKSKSQCEASESTATHMNELSCLRSHKDAIKTQKYVSISAPRQSRADSGSE